MLVIETGVNRDKDHWFYKEKYEAWSDDIRTMFLDWQREHGRCTGKVWVDKKDGSVQHVGWTFEKLKKYQNSDDTYLHETWIEIEGGVK